MFYVLSLFIICQLIALGNRFILKDVFNFVSIPQMMFLRYGISSLLLFGAVRKISLQDLFCFCYGFLCVYSLFHCLPVGILFLLGSFYFNLLIPQSVMAFFGFYCTNIGIKSLDLCDANVYYFSIPVFVSIFHMLWFFRQPKFKNMINIVLILYLYFQTKINYTMMLGCMCFATGDLFITYSKVNKTEEMFFMHTALGLYSLFNISNFNDFPSDFYTLFKIFIVSLGGLISHNIIIILYRANPPDKISALRFFFIVISNFKEGIYWHVLNLIAPTLTLFYFLNF